jgi:hypothetical protein
VSLETRIVVSFFWIRPDLRPVGCVAPFDAPLAADGRVR